MWVWQRLDWTKTNEKRRFFKKIIRRVSFVTIPETSLDSDIDEHIVKHVREAVEEMDLTAQGKATLSSVNEFLKELDEC